MSRQIVDDALEALLEATWIGKNGSIVEHSGRFDAVRQADVPTRALLSLGKMRAAARSKLIRAKLGMTLEEFSLAFRIPVGILASWENLQEEPTAAEYAFLLAIGRAPESIMRALSDEAA